MWAWLRGKGRVDYQIPPQEAAAVSRMEALAGVDIRLSELAGIPPWARTGEHWDELDRLLDRRMRLTVRPPVPVVPGRTS
jgi:hypothetical protein